MPNFRDVDREKMKKALRTAGDSAAGRILRLAWQAGLKREELRTLLWGQVDFAAWQILLKERSVPMQAELVSYLMPLREDGAIHVVHSRRDKLPLTAQTVSHMAREALSAAGLEQVRLTDLRGDFARALLQQGKDWQAVSRLTGLEAAALRPLMHEGIPRTRRAAPPPLDAGALEALIEREGSSPAGLAVALGWQAGLGLEEIAALRWEQVSNEGIILPAGVAPLPPVLAALRRDGEKEGFVIATRTGRPFDRARLSRLVRAALVEAGMDNVTLRDLRRLGTQGQEAAFLNMAQRSGVTLRQVREALDIEDAAARHLAQRLCRRGALTRLGTRYYAAGSVVPPQEQEKAIVEYLAQEGFAYRQDIARLLHISPPQCRGILGRLVAQGKIALQEQRYYLPSVTQKDTI
ncbi:MAG: tyrosine-type recombinase/integrase [Oscillospiraceae bacterium]|nr:tyrosine-type recombinase/integrase [Oscillospiraceae bacterium]